MGIEACAASLSTPQDVVSGASHIDLSAVGAVRKLTDTLHEVIGMDRLLETQRSRPSLAKRRSRPFLAKRRSRPSLASAA